MSVDYYFACGKHMECIHVAHEGLSGFAFYRDEPDCMEKLGAFLEEHTLCSSILYLPEYHVDDMKEREWRVAERRSREHSYRQPRPGRYRLEIRLHRGKPMLCYVSRLSRATELSASEKATRKKARASRAPVDWEW